MNRILIVEDDVELRQLFARVLEKNGYQVETAENGAEALKILGRGYVDLIISDIMMPVMDGNALVRVLRDDGVKTPVLMITAKSTLDDMREGFLSGTDDYMVKPVDEEEMLLRIAALLRRSRIVNEHLSLIHI